MYKYQKNKTNGRYDQNKGKPGVVYILDNPGLATTFFKIGQTTRTGNARANDLNNAATTGMPGEYKCIFEYKTKDCWTSEQLVHEKLKKFRRGKKGQEFFNLEGEDFSYAIEIIKEVCHQIDEKILQDKIRKEAQEKANKLAEEELTRANLDKAHFNAEQKNVEEETKYQKDETLTSNTKPHINSETQNAEKIIEIISILKTKQSSEQNNNSGQKQQVKIPKKSNSGWWILAGIFLMYLFFKGEVPDNSQLNLANQSFQQVTPKNNSPEKENKTTNIKKEKYIHIHNECEEEIAAAFSYFNKTQQVIKSWWTISRLLILSPPQAALIR